MRSRCTGTPAPKRGPRGREIRREGIGPRAAAANLLFLLTAGFLGVSACNPFSAPTREEARAVVTTEQTAQVRIITSRHFALNSAGGGEGPDVELDQADTLLVQPRFDRTFDIRETRRFYIQVEPTDSVSLQATLEVFIDGESQGLLSGDLLEEPLQSVFLSAEF